LRDSFGGGFDDDFLNDFDIDNNDLKIVIHGSRLD